MRSRHYNTEGLEKIPIMAVAHILGIMPGRGKNVLCIAHHEHTPSMHIYEASNRWHCFACGKNGGVISMVRYKLGYSFQEACEWLISHFGTSVNYTVWKPQRKYRQPLVQVSIRQEIPKEVKSPTNIPDSELMEWLVNEGQLSQEAKRFLFNQRKFKPEIVRQQRIFSISKPEVFSKILLDKFGKERCVKAGFFIDKGNYSYCIWQNPCMVFPFYDIDGHLVSLQARSYSKEKRERYRFLSGIPKRYYNMNSLKNLQENSKVYIAEGVTDCLALLSEGKNAIAVPGALNVVVTDTVPLDNFMLLMYPDQDNAGNKLFESLSKILKRPIYRQKLPMGIGDYCDYYISKMS